MSGESLLVILSIGSVVGWLAGLIRQGFGFGLLGGIFVGIAGAFVGSSLLGVLGVHLGSGVMGQIGTAVIGAVMLLLFVIGLVSNKR